MIIPRLLTHKHVVDEFKAAAAALMECLVLQYVALNDHRSSDNPIYRIYERFAMEHHDLLHVYPRYDLIHPLRFVVRHTAALLAKAIAHPYLLATLALEYDICLEFHVTRKFDYRFKLSEKRQYLAELNKLSHRSSYPLLLFFCISSCPVAEVIEQAHF